MLPHRSLLLAALSISAFTLFSCSKESEPSPIVQSLQVKELQETKAPAIGADGSLIPGRIAGSIEATITLDTKSLLNRTFLYGAALQNSSIREEELETALMGISLTQLPAHFRIFANRLRLETDASINFESDVPMPPRLILDLPIVARVGDLITVKTENASPILGTFVFGKESKGEKYSYIRSIEHIAADELFLIETTIEEKDGSRAGFMESIRPRDLVIPADAKPILANAEENPLAERYRFLDAGDFFHESKPGVRTKTKAANRFLRKNGEPIKWYVFGNVPEQYLKDIRNGVEAWNRYIPNLIRFEGKLPEGIKLGDPRFNTIVWDTVQEAGAAYESQNADPVTGIQTQSLIYIPLAWINIGKDYWTKITPGSQVPDDTDQQRMLRVDAVKRLLSKRKIAGRKIPIHCMEAAKELNVRIDSDVKPDEFARELLKGVVMHEVGHALGLAHNFRGSLSYDADDSSKPFSTSIMDYNHYNEEDGAFSALEESSGPLLEYDRQIISVLYNEGKDVKDQDPELSACNDEEADSNEGGVDPLCNRYDIGADPTAQALRALELFTKEGAHRGRMQSITSEKMDNALLSLPPASAVKTKDELIAAMKKGIAGVSGTAGIYIAASANSFGYLASQSVKSLKVFREDVLPEGLKEEEMRDRALQAFEAGIGMNEFPAVTRAAVDPTKTKLLSYLSNSAYVAGLERTDQEALLKTLEAALDKAYKGMETALLSRLRLRFIQSLGNTPTAPLAFHIRNGQKMDLEQVVMNGLVSLASAKAGTNDRPAAERMESIKALKSYYQSEAYQSLAGRIKIMLEAEIQDADSPQKREVARSLKAALLRKPAEKNQDAKK